MDKSSKLIPSKIKTQCESAIKMLMEDNEKLIGISNSIDTFVNERSIVSVAFSSLKDQMSNFTYAVNTMKMANEADIEAYRALSNMVGDEELDGAVLLEQLEEAQKSKKASEEKVASYRTILSNTNAAGAFYDYNNTALKKYEQLISADDAIIKKIQEKIDFYDNVDANSAGLFGEGQALRAAAISAMGEINKSNILNNTYNVQNPKAVQDIAMSQYSLTSAQAGKSGDAQGNGEFISEYNYMNGKVGKKAEYDLNKKQAYLKYKAEGGYAAYYGGYHYNNGEGVDASIGNSIGKVEGEAQIKANAFDKDGNFRPEATLSLGGEMNYYEVSGSMKLGNENTYSKTTVEGNVGVLEAKGTMKAEVDEDGSGYDVELGGELRASVFSGEVKQNFNIYGYELEITAEGNALSAGVKGELSYDSGTFKANVGASALVGGSVGIKIGKAVPEE